MPELPMTARGPDMTPTIGLQHPDDFAHFHVVHGHLDCPHLLQRYLR
jgi:hypothetical protein